MVFLDLSHFVQVSDTIGSFSDLFHLNRLTEPYDVPLTRSNLTSDVKIINE